MNLVVQTLDTLTRIIAPLLPRVVSGGASWLGEGHSSFWDVWADTQAFYVRMGRLEVVLDRRNTGENVARDSVAGA